MGGTAWAVKNRMVSAEELLRYAMSLFVAVTICGMDRWRCCARTWGSRAASRL